VWGPSRGPLSVLLAIAIIPGGKRHGFVLTCMIRSADGLPLGWPAATSFCTQHPLSGVLNLCTWLTALAAAAFLSPVSQLINTQSGR